MIVDVANELYTDLKTTVTSATVYKQRPLKVPVFPCVTLSFSTPIDSTTIDSSGENYNLITVNVNIYSDSEQFNTEIWNIRKEVDARLADFYKLERNVDEELDNIDPNLYRWVMRYDGVVSSDSVIYRR